MLKFKWRVPESGYRWEHVRDELAGDEWPCVSYLVPIKDWPFREIELAQYTGLFRTFAIVAPTEEGILGFANRFGNLGGVFDVRNEMRQPIDLPDGESAMDEDEVADRKMAFRMIDGFSLWEQQITEMRKCVAIWENLKNGEGSEEDEISLRIAVNANLENQVRVSLRRVGQISRHALVNRPKKPTNHSQLAIHLIPESLLGALWVQLAMAIGGNKEHRMCGTCGEWFELSPKVARTNRHYCSEACRSRAYRSRKEQANRLATEGKAPEEIAKELGSDVETVQGWLKTKGDK